MHEAPAPVDIRTSRPDDEARLREIARAGKAYWKYDPDRVREWAATLDFGGAEVYVAEIDGVAVAWASLIPGREPMWLDDLWVEPAWIGRGVGSLLFQRCIERAVALGAEVLEWEAEPNAVGFYENVGGRYLRDSEPSVWGRTLPVMGIDLTEESN